jgi:serine protease Do
MDVHHYEVETFWRFAMRKHGLLAISIFSLLVSLAHAGQTWYVNSWQPYGIPSEDSGTSSYLGVDIADITAERVATLKLKEEQGVEVTMVDQDAPAGKAGIKEHDVILSMNGTAVESKSQLQRMIHETPPGRTVALGLSRDGQLITIKLQLADRSEEFHVSKIKDNDFHFQIPPIPNVPDIDIPSYSVVVVQSSERSGLMVENLTPQLGEFFGSKDGKGVLVRSVEKGSRGDRAGLRAGDVIVRVGGQFVHDTSDFTHALHSHGSINVEVIRDRKPQTFTISLPERHDSGEMMEESFEAPEIDAETQTELTAVQSEVAQLRPQIELAVQQVRESSTELGKSICEQEKQVKEQALKLDHQYKAQVLDEMRKTRDQLRKQRDQMRKQMEQLRRQISSQWLDI